MEETEQKFSKDQIRALADYWPVFANPKFVYETQDKTIEGEGVVTMPSISLSDEAKTFNKMIYQMGWVLEGFDWSEWSQTDEFRALFSKPDVISKASAHQLAMLLTALVRKERFCQGTMASACSEGLLL